MAEFPTPGASEDTWGEELQEALLVGHANDGTHNQEDWTPSVYAGEQSITFPNGLIFKHGIVAASANPVTITFDVAFPTKVISHNAISAEVSQQDQQTRGIATISTYKIYNPVYANIANYSWQVWGY